jgi:hypothetical protein
MVLRKHQTQAACFTHATRGNDQYQLRSHSAGNQNIEGKELGV